MNYTENYELPLIEGTDVIDYAPYNESMNKVDTALNDMGDNVEQVNDNMATLTDRFNEQVSEIHTALQQTESDVNAALEQTTEDINASVNSQLATKDKEIEKLKSDKENLIQVNGSLLQQVAMGTEDDLKPNAKQKEEPKIINFNTGFDKAGNFLK